MIALPPAAYDPDRRLLVGPKGFARVTRREHDLLTQLALRRGRLVTLDALISAVWSPPEDEPERPINAMRVHLHRLRAKLKAVGASADLIQNIWGVGCLLAPLP